MDQAISFIAIVVFLFVGLRSLVNVYMRIRNCTERTEALVTGYEESYVTDTNSHTEQPTYAPVFTFYAGGRNVTAVSNVSRGSRKYDIGERVMIRYNPKDPKEISAPCDNLVNILVGVGGIAAAAAVLIFPEFR